MPKITLKNKIKVNDKDIKELNLNLNGLKAKDLAEAEREFLTDGGSPSVPLSFNFGYCLYVAAKASKLNSFEFKEELSAKDSITVVGEVQSFLLEVELPHKS